MANPFQDPFAHMDPLYVHSAEYHRKLDEDRFIDREIIQNQGDFNDSWIPAPPYIPKSSTPPRSDPALVARWEQERIARERQRQEQEAARQREEAAQSWEHAADSWYDHSAELDDRASNARTRDVRGKITDAARTAETAGEDADRIARAIREGRDTQALVEEFRNDKAWHDLYERAANSMQDTRLGRIKRLLE